MSKYYITDASDDWQCFINIYNRHIKYAPYTLPLSQSLLETTVLKAYNAEDQLALICSGSQGQGIIHAGFYMNELQDGGNQIGLIYLLLGDHNNISELLLREAENWFRGKKTALVRACNWRTNPYQYILHGSETYVWGGFISSINAYNRLAYDLTDESVIMLCNLNHEPVVPEPQISGCTLSILKQKENNVVCQSKIIASVDGKEAGHCTYDDLTAISRHFNKRIGQISIHVNSEHHGKGLGPALLLSAHRELYRQGVRQVMLHTVQRLFRAIKLYEKVGYQEQNIRGFMYEKELTDTAIEVVKADCLNNCIFE